MAERWSSEDASARKRTLEQLAQLEADTDAHDTAALKSQLVGSWRLLFASDGDAISRAGMVGLADAAYLSVAGHFQRFDKPDPMDVINGLKNRVLMRTIEVIHNVKDGVAMAAELKGGWYVGPLADVPLGVLETYGVRELNGAPIDVEARNRWTCTYLGDEVRVCRSEGGGVRAYERIDDADAAAKALREEGVEVDAAAVAAFEEEQRLREEALEAAADTQPEDDPNDDRPLWQKRLDDEAKKEGRYVGRTKDGTPINNWGPIA